MAKREKIENAIQLFEELKKAANKDELDDTIALIDRYLQSGENIKQLISPNVRLNTRNVHLCRFHQVCVAKLGQQVVPHLIEGLVSPVDEVRSLTLRNIVLLSALPEGAQFLVGQGIAKRFLDCIGDEDFSSPENGVTILTNICATVEGSNFILSEESIFTINSFLKRSSTIKFRIYELISRTSIKYNTLFAQFKALGYLKLILDEFSTDDLLAKLNVIAILGRLASSSEGLTFMIESEILNKLIDVLTNPKPEDFLLLPNVVTLVGDISGQGEKQFTALRELGLFPALQRLFEHESDEVVLAAIWAVANSGTSNTGLDALLSAPDAKSLLAEWLEFAYSSNVELRCGTLKSIASIFDRREQDDEAALGNMEKLYRLLYEGTPTERLLTYLGESLIEIRFASFALLKAISKHRFGVVELSKYPGMPEFLLNRNTESSKPGKEWKFAIVQQLLNHPQVKELAGVQFYHELLYYIKQGPFYSRMESRVILEDQAM